MTPRKLLIDDFDVIAGHTIVVSNLLEKYERQKSKLVSSLKDD